MKILVVRLSSLGDVLHLFPAISDLRRRFPDAQIHWLTEPAFAQLAGWHSAVDRVIEVPLRSHKKTWHKVPRLLRSLGRTLKAEQYDLVLDAQGLLKSALLARLAGTEVFGFDKPRESLAARLYSRTAKVSPGLHIVDKNRQLVAGLFGADISQPADFGLESFKSRQIAAALPDSLQGLTGQPCLVLLHGTTWNSKYWPESSWRELVGLLGERGVHCLLPWGNEEEHRRAQRLATGEHAHVLPGLSLSGLMSVLLHAQGFVSVESGIGHLATVLDIPGIMLHGPTDPGYSGILGKRCEHLTSGLDCSPCFRRNCPKLASADGIPPCQLKLTARLVFERCIALLDSMVSGRAC